MNVIYKELKEHPEYFKVNVLNPILVLAQNNHWFIKSFPENTSIYMGYWIEKDRNFYKIISDIKFQEEIEEIEIINPQKSHLILKDGNIIKIFLENNEFHLESLKPVFVIIDFDIRKLYSTINEGQIYNFIPNSSSFFIHFSQIKENFELDLLINFEGDLKLINKFNEKEFKFDKDRNSSSFRFNILNGFQGYLTNFVLKVEDFNNNLIEIEDTNISIKDFIIKRILSLFSSNKLRAGLFWFPQRWFRDELITLMFTNSDKNIKDIQKVILDFYLNNLEKIWDKNKEDDYIKTADTLPLIINTLDQSLLEKNKKILIDFLREWEKEFIKEITKLPPKSTWIDTKDRENAIEVDVMYLKALERLGLVEEYKKYKTILKAKIYSNLYPQNEIISPNIFIAYFIDKNLFEEYEWIKIFDEVIEKHYLNWGGFSSKDKNDPNFYWYHTGENGLSYHNGDSWFWINNLGAYVLSKINYKKYEKIIEKIKYASLTNLLKIGALGYMSELSSAKEFRAEGCPVQLWSISSLYLLL